MIRINIIPLTRRTDNEIIQTIKDLTGGFGVDCVMEVAGFPPLIPLGLKCLRMGGRYIEIGCVFTGANFTCDAGEIAIRRLTIKGIHNYDTRHLQMGIDFLSMTHKIFPFRDIVTHRVSLDNVNDGLRIAESGKAVRVAVLP